jgi:hypothetical protein
MPLAETLNPTRLFQFHEKRQKKAPDEPGQTSQGGNLFTWLEEEAFVLRNFGSLQNRVLRST